VPVRQQCVEALVGNVIDSLGLWVGLQFPLVRWLLNNAARRNLLVLLPDADEFDRTGEQCSRPDSVCSQANQIAGQGKVQQTKEKCRHMRNMYHLVLRRRPGVRAELQRGPHLPHQVS
jgi:hypothetical protein